MNDELTKLLHDEMPEFHGCCTGDCPHETSHECVASLIPHVAELCTKHNRLIAVVRELLPEPSEYGTTAEGKRQRALAILRGETPKNTECDCGCENCDCGRYDIGCE